jgi:UDP-N-acetylmuramoyl-L-alanyl-D-glutamate--2,6-diaminopimelate ligase
VEHTGLTTPDPVLLQQQFRRFVDEGVQACAIEASSIGIVERRLDGTRDPRRRLHQLHPGPPGLPRRHGRLLGRQGGAVRWPGLQAAVINLDDERGTAGAALKAGALDLWTFSCERPARLQAQEIGYGEQGLRFTWWRAASVSLLEPADRPVQRVQPAGRDRGDARLGVPLAGRGRACGNLLPVPGRMERCSAPASRVVAVDYAHTPDALDKALLALQPLAAQRGGKLWCVFGCGGDRDRSSAADGGGGGEERRPRGRHQRQPARREARSHHQPDPAGPLAQPGVQVQADRASPSRNHCRAAPQDVILLAGKGHEDYQECAA